MKGYGSDKPINMRQTAEITLYNNKCIPMEICSRVPVFPQNKRCELPTCSACVLSRATFCN